MLRGGNWTRRQRGSDGPSASSADMNRHKMNGRRAIATSTGALKAVVPPSGDRLADLPPGQSAGYLVREAHRAFLRALAARVSRHGVSIGMWYFLRALWEEDGLTQRELSRRVGMMEPTTATALESMKRRGLISRTRNARDRRKVNIRLTEEGRRLREVLLPCAIEVNQVALAGIPREQIPLLREQLARIKLNLDADVSDDAGFARDSGEPAERAPLHKGRHKD
jgi:DNA-binding MarR family transcriptional regulator